jgi:sugar-specific transcriptional regulator TrmB
MSSDESPEKLLSHLDLKEYEHTALEGLLQLGRTTAPNLSEAVGIPQARVYGVLENLADRGFIKIIPGRPKEYQPKAPEEILDRAVENQRQEYESYQQEIDSVREEFVAAFQPLYERAEDEISPTEELFYVVDVGEPSEQETRALYEQADERICVITKSFEYFENVEPGVEAALERGIDLQFLLLHPKHLSEENQAIQREIVENIQKQYPDIEIRFSSEQLPWRGTIADPDMDYETGEAILLVEEEDIPLHQRQAAVTENASFVAGMQRYFDLIWEHESLGEYPE